MSRIILILLTAFLFGSVQTTWAFLGLGEVTTSWKEEVTLQSGQILLVERTVTHGPDEWWRKGRGKIEKQTISFSYKGKHVKWKADGGDWPWGAMPLMLDIINDVPVIVMPVYNMGPCSKYDFPQEGIVAFIFHNNGWSLFPTRDLPQNLKINLLQSAQGIKSDLQYKNRNIDVNAKRDLESNNNKEYKQGVLISDSIKHLADIEDSCARIRPLSNPHLDAVKQKIDESLLNARTINATITSTITVPEAISSNDFYNDQYPKSCQSIVKRNEPLFRYEGSSGGRSTIGFQLVLSNSEKLPITYDLKNRGGHLVLTTCDNNIIYVIRRQNVDHLLIHRFTYSGDVLDAFLVALPDAGNIVSDKNWGWILTATPMNDRITIVLADYTYTQTASLGGTINKKQIYSVRLTR